MAKKEKAPKPKSDKKQSSKKSGSAEYNIVKTKPEKIAFQNLLFGTNEKHLMVSDEFLYNMAVKYISKRIKIINTDNAIMSVTKSPAKFFQCAEEIETYIEDLIIYEPYYFYKKPIPSFYKKTYFENKQNMIKNMIRRTWKGVLQKYPIVDNKIEEQNIPYYDAAINEMLKFKDKLSEDDMSLIDEFYKRIHGEYLNDSESEPEEGEASENAENTEIGAENQEDDSNIENSEENTESDSSDINNIDIGDLEL